MTPGFAGAITNLAAGSTEPSSMTGSLGTAAAGSVNGGITVHQNSNDTISGLLNTALPDQTPAVANVLTTAPMDFRIVHVGDPARTRSVTVQNGAAVTALNDEPVGSTSAGGAPFWAAAPSPPPAASLDVTLSSTPALSEISAKSSASTSRLAIPPASTIIGNIALTLEGSVASSAPARHDHRAPSGLGMLFFVVRRRRRRDQARKVPCPRTAGYTDFW